MASKLKGLPLTTKDVKTACDVGRVSKYLSYFCYDISDKTKLFNNIQGSKIFSKFDCKSGFWQIKMHPDRIEVVPNDWASSSSHRRVTLRLEIECSPLDKIPCAHP